MTATPPSKKFKKPLSTRRKNPVMQAQDQVQDVSKVSLKDQVRNAFVAIENRWLLSSEIHEQLPNLKKQSLYATVSTMAQKNELERRNTQQRGGGDYEYRLYEATYLQLTQNFTPESAIEKADDQPLLVETEDLNLELPSASPDVVVIPEGVRARRKSIFWNRGQKLHFCVQYLKAKQENPLAGFQALCEIAQSDFAPEDRKPNLNSRAQLAPWFDRTIDEAQKVIEAENEQAARLEREALLEKKRLEDEERREHERRANHQSTMLQGLGSDVLFGEIMRRGQTILETMLIQALTSPKVRDALANAVGDRRSEVRHNPVAQGETRERLERIGILGVNKPVHQGQLRHNLKNMFDLRFGNIDGNSAKLQAAMAGCDLVIVLTEHVSHTARAQLKASNIEHKLMSGDKRDLEKFLSERYLEKNSD